MVEFGLKLEDNKVDEWAAQYIDYEKLKAVLKRAKLSAANRDDLIKRMPSGALAEVENERKDRLAMGGKLALQNNLPPTEYKGPDRPTDSKPLKMVVHPLEVSDKRSSSSLLVPNAATDTTPLLRSPMKRLNSGKLNSGSWGSNINQTVFKVTSYFGFADERILLNQAYDDADEKLNLFKQTYEQEVKKGERFLPRKDR